MLSCGGSAGPTCVALSQDNDAQQKISDDDRTVHTTKGVIWKGFGSIVKYHFEGVAQWHFHSQLDYNRYYATGFKANCQTIALIRKRTWI